MGPPAFVHSTDGAVHSREAIRALGAEGTAGSTARKVEATKDLCTQRQGDLSSEIGYLVQVPDLNALGEHPNHPELGPRNHSLFLSCLSRLANSSLGQPLLSSSVLNGNPQATKPQHFGVEKGLKATDVLIWRVAEHPSLHLLSFWVQAQVGYVT